MEIEAGALGYRHEREEVSICEGFQAGEHLNGAEGSANVNNVRVDNEN